MYPAYTLADTALLLTPSIVVYPELILANIQRILAMAASPDRLRPHVKTHKTREIVRMLLEAGIAKHKCATIAEAEMLASENAPDVLIAYPLVGPNVGRLLALIRKYPGTRFSTLIDHPLSMTALAAAAEAAGTTVDVVLDLDVGQNRTGIAIGSAAIELYERAASLKGLRPAGFQVYDGHNTGTVAEREASVASFLAPILEMRASLERRGIPVPGLVCGGTPAFGTYAALTGIPGLECSPGTFVLHDAGYSSRYPDLAGITPAAVLATRVISRPTSNRVTFDLGTKAVASDPPAGKRVVLLDFPEYEAVAHNEEHFVVETASASQYQPGDLVYALPTHICPTMALHREVLVAESGRIVGKWEVVARDRMLSV